MDKFLTSIKRKYSNRPSSHDQKQYPPRYSSEPVKLELVVKKREHKPTSTYPDNQLVPYSDIFKKEKEQVVRKVLIEGGAGIGKTTFCLIISEGWANKKLFKEFEVLLLLPLYEKRIAASNSLAELIKILQGTKKSSNSIADSIMKTNGEDVLLVADGWDELDAPESSRTLLHDLLFGSILNLASIIVTSRPSHSDMLFTKGCFDRSLSMHGFDDGSIRQYIRRNIPNNQPESDRLLEIVDCNPQISSMCRIPLNCASLCHLWRTTSQEQKFSITDIMAELCDKMRLNVVLHNVKKSLPEELKRIMIDLVEDVNKTKYDFLSPAIQEYLPALDVAHNVMPDELIQKEVTDFWRFLFGICGQITSNLALLERAIQSLSKFDYLRCLICHCAFEAKNPMIDKKAIEALSTPSGSKHFGDPQTTHDCEAILYVIKRMRNIDAQLELNFKDCDFKQQQLCDLTKILTKKDNKIKVKSIDLSNKSNLSNGEVADLFKKALTAFQSLERLSLRRNKIGKKIGHGGAVYTMKALFFLKCLTRLDLSINPLTISGLEALHDNVKDDCLTQLKILLLQAALTSDAKENIYFLTAFTQSLMRHCHKLRELDISENDLGKPGSPFISAVICTLTKSGVNLHVNKEYESEVDENFIKTMEDLVRRQEKIDHTVVHGIIVGPGRSGKNSLMDRLMGKGPLDPGSISPSTGVLDSVIKVEVKKLCTMDAATTSLKWTKLEYDQEALELMMITIKTHIASLADEGRNLITPIDKPIKYPSAVMLVEKSESETESENDIESEYETESEGKNDSDLEEIAVPEVAKAAITYPHYEIKVSSSRTPNISYSKEFSLREGPMDIFKRAIELRHRMCALREYLESTWSLYLTNTGGQLEFQELLPLLVCGPSVFFVTIPLNSKFDEPYTVRYQYPNGTEETYLSSSTLMDEILQTLATIAALDCTRPQLEEVDHKPIKPKVFFIGTHKDKLLELADDGNIQDVNKQPKDKVQDIDKQLQDKIQPIDRQLQDKIKQTSLDKKISIEYAEGTDQLMFTVNNLDKDDCDFQKIRLALQRRIDRDSLKDNKEEKEFTITCPCSWLVFSLVLRAKHESSQVLSYNDCFTIAQSCGISKKGDFNKALLFIHHGLGLIRYFPVEGLNEHVIIDPHLMFDTITKLIIETFISDHASEREIKDLQKKGIFSKEAMRTISLKNYSDLQLPFEWTLKLLKHLRIAASFKDQNGEEKYFFPSVICHAPDDNKQGSNVLNCSIKLPPPLSIAFDSGFCPRGIPGILVKSLMNNEMKSSICWKLYQRRVFRNQVSFSVGPADIILKILPTHIEVCFDPESGTADQNEINVTCEEAYKQIKRVMSDIIVKFRECDYYFAFNCTRSECKEHPHPAKIDWDILKLECRITERKSHLPNDYELWTQIGAYYQGNCDYACIYA